MKSKVSVSNMLMWWVFLLVILMAIATIWWFGREIRSIDRQMENMEKI